MAKKRAKVPKFLPVHVIGWEDYEYSGYGDATCVGRRQACTCGEKFYETKDVNQHKIAVLWGIYQEAIAAPKATSKVTQ